MFRTHYRILKKTTCPSSWALWGFGILIVLLALVPRLAGFQRDTWQDEIRHIHSAVSAITIRDLLRNISGEMQPGFEYFLRRFFWQPLIGQEERSARLVSLIYGVSAVFASYWVVAKYLLRQKLPSAISIGLAFWLALTLAMSPTAIYNSIEARHYSLIFFISVLWFSDALLFHRLYSKRFFWLSFFFACTFFFSLYLVGLAALWQLLSAWRGKDRRKVRYALVYGIAIPVLVILLNRYSFAPLFKFAPAEKSIDFATLVRALERYWQFFHGDTQLWILLPVIALGLWRKSKTLFAPLLLATIFFFGFIFLLQSKSAYPIFERYLLFYWGLFPALLALSACELWRLWLEIGKVGKIGVAGVLLSLAFATLPYSHLREIPHQVQTLSWPSRNFTSLFQVHAKIKEERAPVFLFYADPFTFQIPEYYFRHVNPPFEFGYQAYDSLGGNGIGLDKVKLRLQEWLDVNPNGVIYLDPRGQCRSGISPPHGVEGHTFQKRCLWRISGRKTYSEILHVMRQVQFPFHPDLN